MPSWVTVDRALLVLILALLAAQGLGQRDDHALLEQTSRAVTDLTKKLEEAQKRLADARAAGGASGPSWGSTSAGARPEFGARVDGGEGGALTSGGPGAPEGAGGAALSPGAAGGTPGGSAASRLAKVKRQLAASGMTMMDVVYDAVDRMAAEEQWDDATYDEVASVFEQSAGRMVQLYQDVQTGQLTPQEARDEGLAMRDDALGRLQGRIGPEGIARLKTHWRDAMASGARPPP